MRPSSRAGAGGERRQLLRLLLLALTALWMSSPAPAGATSGGASITPPIPKRPQVKPPSRSPSAKSHSAAQGVQGAPFEGRGMWIWYVSQSSGGNLSTIISTARSYGLSTLIIKAGDGASAWSQFNPQLVATLHASGLKVCAWQYVYGDRPIGEAEVGAAAVRAGADCLLIDAESEYQGKYVQAQEYIGRLRQLIGPSFPVGLAGFPYVDYHPGFPYSVFLGPGGAQYNVPQMYWPDIGDSVQTVYAHTFEFNQLYQRPVEPLGELSGDPPPPQVVLFRQLSRVYGATLISWWDWQSASPQEWQAIAEPFADLEGFTPPTAFPVLSVASQGGIRAGDLVVWAQEHLAEAGEPVQIDGDFGAQTEAAVDQFQVSHGLPVTGVIDQPTWQALLRYPRPTVVWTTQKGMTTASAARVAKGSLSVLTLPVPWSARLPARGYEIPRDLGAGGRDR